MDSKALRKKRLVDSRKKLINILNMLEIIALDDEANGENIILEDKKLGKKMIRDSEQILDAVEAINAAVFLINNVMKH